MTLRDCVMALAGACGASLAFGRYTEGAVAMCLMLVVLLVEISDEVAP